MGLISGSVSCTRFNVVALPNDIDFDRHAFHYIQKGSYTKESIGFIPFEPGEPYLMGEGRYGFRLRIDKIQIDATQLKEKLRELIRTETELSGPPNKKKLRDLKDMAEEELLLETTPKTKIIEGYLDQYVLTIGTTAKSQIGTVTSYLRKLGIELEFKTPWFDLQLEQDPPAWLEFKDPAQSILGCLFLKKLQNDQEIYIEGVKGSARLSTPDGTTVSIRGVIANELNRYLDQEAEIIAAKLQIGDTPLTFDGSTFRISSMRIRAFKADHWTIRLEARMEQVEAMYELLEDRFQKMFGPKPNATA